MTQNNVLSASANLYALGMAEAKTYLFAFAFVVGNILFPQLCHAFGLGHELLPIYFFTLIAAYKYGINAGLLTALLSPLVNHFLFGMPPSAVFPAIFVKSALLAVFAALFARRRGDVTLVAVVLSVLAYQAVGTLFEFLFMGYTTDAIMMSFANCRVGIMLQIFGGYALLRAIRKI